MSKNRVVAALGLHIIWVSYGNQSRGNSYIPMNNETISQQSQDYAIIAQAIRYLEAHRFEQPGLSQLAQSLHLSEYHLQRVFSRWVGISPKKFMHYLTKEHAKQLLKGSQDLLTTAHGVGLSGPGRLHDMFVAYEAMSPGEYKALGSGLRIKYGIHASPFGDCLVALTARGICNLLFIQNRDHNAVFAALESSWPAAQIEEDQKATASIIDEMVSIFQVPAASPMRIFVKGTNFQIKVWEALMQIPAGSVAAYQQIAVQIGMPGSERAVGNAIAKNPIPVLIPCHRVIRKSGEFGAYRWGTSRKKALHGWEMAQLDLAKTEPNVLVSA